MSNVAASHAAYRRGAVLAATPGELVVMLYDGARRFLRQSVGAMQGREHERAHNALRNAERIISHLDGTLDFEQGGEIAQQLHSIYVFCLSHLRSARVSQDTAKVEQVNDLLGELRDAWNQAATIVDGGAQVAAGA